MQQTALLLRRRDAAALLAVSVSQVLKWEREGLLHAIDLNVSGGNIRAVRYDADEVKALAARFVRDAVRSICA